MKNSSFTYTDEKNIPFDAEKFIMADNGDYQAERFIAKVPAGKSFIDIADEVLFKYITDTDEVCCNISYWILKDNEAIMLQKCDTYFLSTDRQELNMQLKNLIRRCA